MAPLVPTSIADFLVKWGFALATESEEQVFRIWQAYSVEFEPLRSVPQTDLARLTPKELRDAIGRVRAAVAPGMLEQLRREQVSKIIRNAKASGKWIGA